MAKTAEYIADLGGSCPDSQCRSNHRHGTERIACFYLHGVILPASSCIRALTGYPPMLLACRLVRFDGSH